MGGIAVDFFLETLNQLRMSSKLDFTIEEIDQLQNLEEDIIYLREFLKITEEKHKQHPEGMKLVMQIRDVISEAENAVGLFVDLVSEEETSDAENAVELFGDISYDADHACDSLREHQDRLFVDLQSIEKAFENLIAEVKLIYDDYEKHSSTRSGGIGSGLSGGSNPSKVVQEQMVIIGFENEVRRLVYMLGSSESDGTFKTISIIGAAGGGKTTLAREIYDYPSTLEIFEFRAWVVVSQDYNKSIMKNLLIGILESAFPKNHEDYEKSSNDMLIEKLFNFLWGKKYLIVMDDIWGLEAWYDIQASLPMQKKGSRVVFTSRQPFKFGIYCSYEFQYSAPYIEGSRPGFQRVIEDGSNPSNMVERDVITVEGEVSELVGKLCDSGDGGTLQLITIVCKCKTCEEKFSSHPTTCETTLTRKIYYHPLTSESFEFRAIIFISPQKEFLLQLLIGILKSAFPQNYEDYKKSSEDMWVKKILKFLRGKKYLIVIDGEVESLFDWYTLLSSLPRERKGSKVVCPKESASRWYFQRRSSVLHSLKPLSKSCSWELLEKKVFGENSCPPKLAEIGKKIAEKCEGLPLAIVTIAGLLATEDKTLKAWEEIAKQVISIIAKKQEGCMEILELSYNHLPLHLKVCFLHIGAHPVACEIPIRELICVWIAEGFIQRMGECWEDIAKHYLDDLVDRSLIMVDRRSASTGRMKTCRIHDLLRELCLKKTKEDNFFVQFNGDDSLALSATNKYSRLFICRQFFDEFFFSRPYPQNLRSFMCLGSGHSRIEQYISFFVENFKLLRILSFIPDECRGKILRGQLVHLRYLALQLSETAYFPFPFHLLKLETLIIQTSCLKDIELSSDILKMVKLRHLHCKQGMFTYHVSYVEDEGTTLDSLHTLHKMCICKHCLRFLKKTPNLRKLGLLGDPNKKGDDVLTLLDLGFLECLEILYVKTTSMARTGLKLPRTLTQLTLCHTQLQWEELTIILDNLRILESLKLLTDACCGPVWNARVSQQRSFVLKYLTLRDLDIEWWHVARSQFVRLEVLVIQDCRKLDRMPSEEFYYQRQLREIKVERCSWFVAHLAQKIQRMSTSYRDDFRLTISY